MANFTFDKPNTSIKSIWFLIGKHQNNKTLSYSQMKWDWKQRSVIQLPFLAVSLTIKGRVYSLERRWIESFACFPNRNGITNFFPSDFYTILLINLVISSRVPEFNLLSIFFHQNIFLSSSLKEHDREICKYFVFTSISPFDVWLKVLLNLIKTRFRGQQR